MRKTGVNPKDKFGLQKVSFHVIPSPSLLYEALGFSDGAIKYGPHNYRRVRTKASVFFDAAMRHLLAWHDGEDLAPDSGVPHLGHAKACLGIIIDAVENDLLEDDRPPKGPLPQLLERWKRDKSPKRKGYLEAALSEHGELLHQKIGDALYKEGQKILQRSKNPALPCSQCGGFHPFRDEKGKLIRCRRRAGMRSGRTSSTRGRKAASSRKRG